jgi:hypothetical protein
MPLPPSGVVAERSAASALDPDERALEEAMGASAPPPARAVVNRAWASAPADTTRAC